MGVTHLNTFFMCFIENGKRYLCFHQLSTIKKIDINFLLNKRLLFSTKFDAPCLHYLLDYQITLYITLCEMLVNTCCYYF